MSEPGHALIEPLHREPASSGTSCGRKVLVAVSLVVGSGFMLLTDSVPGSLFGDRQPVNAMFMAVQPLSAQVARAVQPRQFMQPMGVSKPRAFMPAGPSQARLEGFAPGAQASAESEPAKPRGEAVLENWSQGPAEIHSQQGQIANYMLKDNTNLFQYHVEEQLEALNAQREDEEREQLELEQKADKDTEASTLLLRKRKDEVRRTERSRVAMELIYLMVCSKFKSFEVPMIPAMKDGAEVQFRQADLDALHGLNSKLYTGQALELIQDQLFKIIRDQSMSVPGTRLRSPLFELGWVYAACAKFGYSLRKMEKRFQLEKMAGSFGGSLTDYLSSFFESELQQNMVAISSNEARQSMDLHIGSLFGDHMDMKEKFVSALGDALETVTTPEELDSKLAEVINANKVESIDMTKDNLTRLVLEAGAFGTLLNDVESQVDIIYPLTYDDSQLVH
eukprot:gnl/TRDRNA2_/TRDRNA2_52261_c0_seq1.p1 gnl/TRDRNA2_/TRDRNA2_52261_c0~~gnl/TRDRNA2_/TRDRNA2_52261_c0_seq1.p1  ORF type:complete len:476 (-),score=91.02 gnl/TRDRNA2_/TRDRNA2_52261_c0_seq1:188-1537(-)